MQKEDKVKKLFPGLLSLSELIYEDQKKLKCI